MRPAGARGWRRLAAFASGAAVALALWPLLASEPPSDPDFLVVFVLRNLTLVALLSVPMLWLACLAPGDGMEGVRRWRGSVLAGCALGIAAASATLLAAHRSHWHSAYPQFPVDGDLWLSAGAVGLAIGAVAILIGVADRALRWVFARRSAAARRQAPSASVSPARIA